MTAEMALELTSEAVRLSILLAAPLLAAALICGLLCGLLQTVFQVHEHSLSFVPKLLVVAAVFASLMPWLFSRLVEFSHHLISGIAYRI